MNAFFSILFLGWWLFGQWQISRGELYPKPYISIHPRGMVALGGNVSIRCWTESEKHVEYYLTKSVNKSATTPSAKVAGPYHVIFPIVNARISDGGSYWCLYHNKSSETKWSPESDIVYINLTDPILPKPSIEMIPINEMAPGLNVAIQCRGPDNGLTFSLHKGNMQVAFQTTKPETDTAEFLFVMLTLEDAGNYTCQYHQRGSPFVWSKPSQPVELAFRERREWERWITPLPHTTSTTPRMHPDLFTHRELYPEPSTFVHPKGMVALGGNVSIHCSEESKQHAVYHLTKEINSSQHTMAIKDAEPYGVIFPIVNASKSDGGKYYCLYHNKSVPNNWSRHSNTIYINITDPTLSKPCIEMIPTNEIAPGLNVTILCRGPENGLNFSLHKGNMQVAFQTTKPETDTAEFLFVMLTLEDAGNYTCQYHQRGSPFVWSEPSQLVELAFRGSVMAILPASIASGIALLALLFLLLACLLQRKKRKGSITKKENQPMHKASEPDVEEMPDEVSYATLNHQSQKTKLNDTEIISHLASEM